MGLKLKRGNASTWTADNPVLQQGEIGIEIDSVPVKFKIGDGVTAWNSLSYFGGVISGAAGGDLTGTYPNPTIANSAVTAAKISATLDQIAAPVANVGMASHNITNVLDPTAAQHAATKNYVDTRTINNLAAPTADFSMNTHKITNVVNPTNLQDVATKAYVDATAGSGGAPSGPAGGSLAGTYPNPSIASGVITDVQIAAANKDGVATLASMRTLGTGAQQATAGNDSRLTDARNAIAPDWAASTAYATNQIVRNGGVLYRANSAFISGATFNITNWTAIADAAGAAAAAQAASMPVGTTLDAIPNAAGTVNLNSQRIRNLSDPTSAQDAATRNYVDTSDYKGSVRVATTAAGTLSSSFANSSIVDGITLVTGDRILIKDQVTTSENGIYTVNATGAPTRATDAASGTLLNAGAAVYVESGTQNLKTEWRLTTTGTITIGATGLTFEKTSGLGQVSAGTGLTKATDTISLTTPVSVVNGGTGATTLTGLIKGNGTSAFTAAVSGTDYAPPTSGTSVLKGDGAGGFANAVSKTDYAPPTTGSSSLKGDGAGGFAAATLNDNGAPTADFSMASHKLINVTDPINAQDASTKNYVDNAAGKTMVKTAAAWTTANTVLASGQIGKESDTLLIKIGDGTTAWNSLGYYYPGIYLGTSAPSNTNYLWIDTT